MQALQAEAKLIFESAMGLSQPEERQAYLQKTCAANAALRQEVQSLLDAFKQSGSFLQVNRETFLPPIREGAHGQRFGDYELLEEIARGGMGIVYKARQISLNRVVAIKMILAGQFASKAEVKRFQTEAEAAASLTHPNIVGIYEVGEHDGQHYYSMPFVDGKNLAQLVESGKWRAGDGTQAAMLITKVARAVHYAHEAGILHRDLKPGNILVGREGEPRVTDFGLAKQIKNEAHQTLTGHLMGTPGFMAPELARGHSAQSTAAADIYSLGAMLYFLLTGRPPFVADSALDAMLLVLESEAVLPRRINPLVSAHLDHICMRCLEKRPEDRYASAGELADTLERFLKGEPPTRDGKAFGPRIEAWARRRPALAARLSTVLLCLAIVATAYQVHQYTTLTRHLAVISVLAFWLVISFLCQWGLERERHANWIRLLWSAADLVALTAILLIAQAFRSPLLILYPTLIAASGFWVRVMLVNSTTAMALVGYVILLLDSRERPGAELPFHWHLLSIVGIVVTGLSVAYLVNRVSSLTRFYEQRPK